MPTPHVHPLTDWVAALERLAPRDKATMAAIAALIRGAEHASNSTPAGPSETAVDAETPLAAPRMPGLGEPATQSPTAPGRSARPSRGETALPFTVIDRPVPRPRRTPPRGEPAWLAEAGRDPEATPELASGRRAPIDRVRAAIADSLLDPVRARSIIGAAAAMPRAGAVDLETLVCRRANRESVQRLPQLVDWTVARGVQVLVDRGETMQPFAADVVDVLATLRDTVGRDLVETLSFRDSPLDGCGRGPRQNWTPYGLGHAPSGGMCVVVVSDFGLGGLGLPRASASQRAPWDGREEAAALERSVRRWLEFADRLAEQGCGVAAIAPVPCSRLPSALRGAMTVVEWDRQATARAVAISARQLRRRR